MNYFSASVCVSAHDTPRNFGDLCTLVQGVSCREV